MVSDAYVNAIATSVPRHDVHQFFIDFARSQLKGDLRRQAIFERMSDNAGIEHRFSSLAPSPNPEGPSLDERGIFLRNAFPGTARRMDIFAVEAPLLAQTTIERLLEKEDREKITHLIITTCTGFSAPGIDLEVIALCGLPAGIERTIIGFMGCYAAITALKQARHIVRSEPAAHVLICNIELCTLHLRQTANLEKLLSFCLWGDGCAATLVSARPSGMRLDSFRAIVAADSRELMTWNVVDDGFDMFLSGQVPNAIHDALQRNIDVIRGRNRLEDINLWAVHPGGKSVLDAVQRSLKLDSRALDVSREVLRDFGNMSSATVMFVLERMLRTKSAAGLGCAIAFGPGLTAETMMFTSGT